MNKLRTLAGIATVVALTALAGRLWSRQAAIDFGKHVGTVYSVVGLAGFADNDAVDDFFADPHLVTCNERTKLFSFLGGRYDHRIHELKSGMIYLSEQLCCRSRSGSPMHRHSSICRSA